MQQLLCHVYMKQEHGPCRYARTVITCARGVPAYARCAFACARGVPAYACCTFACARPAFACARPAIACARSLLRARLQRPKRLWARKRHAIRLVPWDRLLLRRCWFGGDLFFPRAIRRWHAHPTRVYAVLKAGHCAKGVVDDRFGDAVGAPA